MSLMLRRLGRVGVALIVVVVASAVLRLPRPCRLQPTAGPVRHARLLQGLAALPEYLAPLTAVDLQVQLVDLQAPDPTRVLVSRARHPAALAGAYLPWTLSLPAGPWPTDRQLLVILTLLEDERVSFVATESVSALTAPTLSPVTVTPTLPVLTFRRVPDDATT